MVVGLSDSGNNLPWALDDLDYLAMFPLAPIIFISFLAWYYGRQARRKSQLFIEENKDT